MRILHELNQLEKGGAERVVLGIARQDRDNEHKVYAYKDGPMRPVFERHGIEVLVDDAEKTFDLETDIIHIHTGGEPSRIASAAKGAIPMVETVHSPVVSAVRDEFVFCRVGVSNVVTKMNRKCRTIYNGVDLERLKKAPVKKWNSSTLDGEVIEEQIDFRDSVGIPHDAFVVGRLGRIAPEKMVEDFLLACWMAQNTNLVKDLHVLVVGSAPSRSRCYLGKMKVMAASLPLKNVHWVPEIEEVGWAYRAMDLFLYPSPDEGFGLVFFEAMACGVPVVTWKTELTAELLTGCAWLSGEKTARKLAENIVYFYLNPAVRRQFGAEGFRVARGRFTEEYMASEYQALYREVYAARYGDRQAMDASQSDAEVRTDACV